MKGRLPAGSIKDRAEIIVRNCSDMIEGSPLAPALPRREGALATPWYFPDKFRTFVKKVMQHHRNRGMPTRRGRSPESVTLKIK